MFLESNDGTRFELSSEQTAASALLTDTDEDEVPLPGVDAAQLGVVVAFCVEFASAPPVIPKPLPNEPFADLVGKTYADMVDMPHTQLMAMEEVARYIMIPAFTELLHAKRAHNLKGLTVEEMRALYNIKNDFTPEEEAELKLRYSCFEDGF